MKDSNQSGPDGGSEAPDMNQLRVLLTTTAREDAANGVRPFLADRVMRKIAATRHAAPEEELWQGLVWIFRPVAAACLVLMLVLAVHNVYLSRQYEVPISSVEAVFALPDVSTVAAYELDLTSYETPADP